MSHTARAVVRTCRWDLRRLFAFSVEPPDNMRLTPMLAYSIALEAQRSAILAAVDVLVRVLGVNACSTAGLLLRIFLFKFLLHTVMSSDHEYGVRRAAVIVQL
jgi:hypothetical protein